MRHRLSAVLLGLFLLPSVCSAGNGTTPYRIAVANFDFNDTSGEPNNQDLKHSTLLARFDDALESALADDSEFKVSPLTCRDEPCSLANSGLQALLDAAADTDADYLLIGQMHKMSTLVGWTKFALVEIATGKAVCDRFLTYRGDTEEAWTRAAAGVGRDIKRHCLKRS
ncbi:MAG: DUF3280 domain-containing protein [Rhizobiaceae bacterium]|nr:DUF3280 domain-containing protein [Rhizobiaceae bacterium]